jgi:type I restriction enzyme S subunit
MAVERREVRLGDVARIKHGFAFDGTYFVDGPAEDVLVTPGNFEIGGGFKFDKLKYYRGPVLDDYVLSAGDVVVTMTDLSKASDTLGYSALVPQRSNLRFLHNQRIGKLEVTRPDLVDKDFLYWLLRTPEYRAEILASATGTAIKHTAPGRIEAFCFTAPNLPEQRAIAHVLGTLDDKIELNRKMNATLERIARALFKSWFVDFDPVRAKSEGRVPSDMDAETAKLFPGEFVESDRGRIPQGWEPCTLGRYADLNSETWARATYPASIQYVDLSGTKWGAIESLSLFSREDAPSRAQRVLRRGDTILGTVRPGNGSFALVDRDGLTGSTGFAVLRPRRSDTRTFIYCAATSSENIDRLAHLADGGAYPAVRPELVVQTDVAGAPDNVVSRFETAVAPIIECIASNRAESAALARVRDQLLPRLLSGALAVGSLTDAQGGS